MFNEKKFKFDIENLKQDLAIEDIESVMSIYMSSNQCVYRSRHSEDYQEVSKYLEEHKVHDTSEDESN